jgi:tetratricopeptide (TPR) repeat protein
MLPLLIVLLSFGILYVRAQEESAEEVKYREDYDRLQKVMAIPDLMKRSDGLMLFMNERSDSKLTDYAQGNYLQVIESTAKAEKYPVVVALCERFMKLRPRVGETYYFYGAALKNIGKLPEAMDALAKCAMMKNNASRKAREFLEYVYKSQHQGSIIGLDKLLKKAQDEVGK